MDLTTVLGSAGIIFLAGTAHSVVGFGYALFATPLLVMIGMPLQNAIVLVASCSFFQSALGAASLRHAIPWRQAMTGLAIRLASVMIGILFLKKLAAANMDHMRLAVGLALCLLVLVLFVWKPRPVASLHWAWGAVAFTASGILAGLVGMGGPPLVLWLMAHDWSTRKTRGFLFAVFTMSIPFQLALLALTFGGSILVYAALGIAFVPLVFVGSRIGLPLGNRMAKSRLRNVAYIILLVIGTSAVVQALIP